MPREHESAVGRYIEELPDEMKRIASRVRRIVRNAAVGITEELKWGMPWFSKNGRVCYLKGNEEHVTFGFANGASLVDPDHILEGTGKSMRHVKLRSVDDIRPRQFAQWVCTAARSNGKRSISPRTSYSGLRRRI